MNKLVKGSVAGVAGVTLLLGGAGTFALWHDSATVPAGTIASGTLTIAASGPASWRDISADRAPSTIANIADFRLVPGDTVELVQQLTIQATGTNLQALLSHDPASFGVTDAADQALLNELDITVDVTGANVTPSGTPNEFVVAPSASQSTVTVRVVVALPSSVSGSTAQDGTVDLSGLAFQLEQVRA